MSNFLRNTISRYMMPVRTFSKNAVRFEKHNSITESVVGKFDKYCLKWTGAYKRVEDVPDYLPAETVDKARSRIRIRISNLSMALILLGCLGMVMSGKKAADSGDSLQKRNIEWHKRINEEHNKNQTSPKNDT